MVCPYCEEKMQEGWIDQHHSQGLCWKPNEERGFIESLLEPHGIRLTSLAHGGRLIVYHCEKCRKFVIDENDIEV